MDATTILTTEQLQAKADELGQKHSCKVHYMLFLDENGGQIIGYMKEPGRSDKMRAWDKMMLSNSTAGAELLQICILPEETNSRIYTDAPENDYLYLGAIKFATDLIKVAINQAKKKN